MLPRMLRKISIALVAVAGLAGAASAGEKVGDPGTNVDMPFLIAPMTDGDKLLGYSYISSKLVASSQRAALDIRDKIAFIQDAFVRDVNAAPVGKADDPRAVDTTILSERLLADARKVVGAAKVSRIVFGDGAKDPGIQFAPLHPTQTPVRSDAPVETATADLADKRPQKPEPAAEH